MERLRQSELRSLLAFVQECYALRESETFDLFAHRLVCALPLLIPATHVTYNEMVPERSESRNYTNHAELETEEAGRLWAEHMNEHPVMVHVLKTTDRQARRISDYWSQRQLHDSGLHADFYKAYGIEDALCITVPSRMPLILGVGWHDGRIFTERERLIADLVRPHIAQACQNARMLARRWGEVRTLRAGMDSLKTGVILCDGHGQISFVSALGRRHLENYLDLKGQMDHRLPDLLLRWMRSEELPGSGIDDAPRVRAPLVFERGNRRLVMRLLSRSGSHLILIEEEKMQPEQGVPAAFGLTGREAEVLRWIAGGKTNQEIAIILGLQATTVKKHVEHILMKLGVETRTAAAAMVLGGGASAEAD